MTVLVVPGVFMTLVFLAAWWLMKDAYKDGYSDGRSDERQRMHDIIMDNMDEKLIDLRVTLQKAQDDLNGD